MIDSLISSHGFTAPSPIGRESLAGKVPASDSLSSAVSVPRRSKFVKLSRKWSWMKHGGEYFSVMPYYLSSPDDQAEFVRRLDFCQRTWLKERKGERERYRAVGCGDRVACPACGTYRQMVLANEAVESMLLAQDGVEVSGGVSLECFGLKLVKTIPRLLSAKIEALLWIDVGAWCVEVGKLFKAGYEFNRRWFGVGVGGVCGLHLTGESAPSEPHYHLNDYIFPAVREDGSWRSLSRWTDKEWLLGMRQSWAAVLNKAFGLDLKEADINCGYLKSHGQLNHFISYMYRPLLGDLWAGWDGVNDGEVRYKYAHGRKEKLLGVDALATIASRVLAIPSHFKRMRWFGIFSDGQRAKTMASLDLEPYEVDGDGEAPSERWERTGDVARFVRYVDEGVVLRQVVKDEDGSVVGEEFFDEDGWPHYREMLGAEFVVLDGEADYRPSGVGIGKRKRWRAPGSIVGA